MKNMVFGVLVVSVAAIGLISGGSTVNAAILTAVPMQGGMVMPMVSYHADDGRIHVMMPTQIPQLTPLLVSNPADAFDPADPWFDVLDPSRRGESFSRRYGFVMDNMSDPLPAGTRMWIRKLSNSAELKFYRAFSSAPKVFEPIFGTDGATNAMFWDSVMFHPTVAAPAGTNDSSATFEVYLLDTTTGLEVPDSTSGPLEFKWTNVPDGRPVLSLAPKIVVAWPATTGTQWILEAAGSIGATTWTALTNQPTTVDGQPCVVLDSAAAQQFFRMRFVP